MIAAEPLIGRADELVVADDVLERLERGAHALLIEGEPGIGKTRLWQESIARARGRGYLVLSSRPGGSEVQLAFAGLSDLLAGQLDVLAALPPPQRRALEVALLLADAGDEPPDQRAVSAAFLGVLRVLAVERPVVVAVDDLQWLDRASASVLAFAARRLEAESVGLLSTVRVSPEVTPPAEVADAMAARLTRLPLGPMSISAVYELCRTHLDFQLRRPLLLRVHETAGGRPFLAVELARALRDAGRDVEPHEPLPVPHDLRELLLARLARLPESTQETLLLAAAVSQPTLELLERAIPGRAVDDVDAAAEAGVVELDGSRVRFTHPLLASTHYESAPRARRRETHRRLAEVAADREERARHLAIAADGPEEGVAVALDAAVTHAESRGAVPAAAELAARAVLLTPRSSRVRLHRRRLEAARLAFAAGDLLTAVRLLEEALTSARPGEERAETLLELGLAVVSEELGSGHAILREAAAEPVSDARLRAEILAQLAPREGYSGEGYERALEIAHEAVALAEEAADDKVLADALSTLGYLEHVRGRRIAHDVMRRAEALEAASGLSMEGPTKAYADLLSNCGQNAAAAERLERLVALGREIGDARVCVPLYRLSYVAFETGDWDRAWDLALEAKEIATQSGRETLAPLGDVVLALVEAMRGDVEAGLARGRMALAGTDRAGRHSGGPRGALAFIELSRERYQQAYELIEPFFERMRGLGDDRPGAGTSDAVEALAGLGRVDEAQALLEPFEEGARRLGIPWAIAAAVRCRGLIAAEMGDLESAEAWLEEAVAEGETAEIPLELGRSLLALGSVRRRRQEKRAARDALARALELFEHLGAEVWAERARRELRRIGGRESKTTALSETQQQIVELVIAGRSNKEVAHSLHLSPKTVEWNLSRVYRKLGIHSRTQLAATRRSTDSLE